MTSLTNKVKYATISVMNEQLPTRKEKFINGLGATGYFTGMIQWLAVFALYFAWIYAYFIEPMQPRAQAPSPQPAAPVATDSSEPSLLLMIGLGVLVLVMVSVTIYAFIKLPQMVSRAGSKTAAAVVNQASPLIMKARHLPPTKKNQYKVGVRLLIAIKVLIIVLPLGLAWTTGVIGDMQVVTVPIALLVSAILAAPTALFFGLQYLIAAACKVPLKNLK